MADTDAKSGALTQADLLDIWKGSVDTDYADPLIAAGDSGGMEAYDQFMAQLARVSTAIDATTQALYILPHSSQTNPPAGGARKATTTLSISRTGNLAKPLILGAGMIFAEEVQNDWSEDGSDPVHTGRRYVLAANAFFPPGETGPVQVVATAERVGAGYNNPLIGSINYLSQPGSAFNNTIASVTVYAPAVTDAPGVRARVQLVTQNQADTVIPEHVGQYVRFTGGSNASRVARMTFYSPADLTTSPPSGGSVDLEIDYVVTGFTWTGSFTQGEQVAFKIGAATVGYGFHIADALVTNVTGKCGAFYLTSGTFGTSVQGLASGATLPVDITYENTPIVAESGTASWQVLDWVTDWGITLTNLAQPANGRSPMLDQLGDERKVARAPGESDDAYRLRVAAVADVVTPNAIKRAINKVLVPLGLTGCFREIGQDTFPGLFFDGASTDPSDSAGALDYDFTVNPADRFKVMVDHLEMRAFMLIGVPDIPATSDFGFFFDGTTGDAVQGSPGAFDLYGTGFGALDGFASVTTTVYKAVYQAVDSVRAGGVGFDLYRENVSCP
jgi:hypothetical protein